MAAISLSKLNKHYGSLFHAVKDVDLEIADKEFVALVGPSGCGKSTTLRMIAGLEDISSGDIRIGGKLVNHLPPRDRDVAMVFQNYALYQHMSVYDNLAFGLRNKRVAEAEIKVAIGRAADILGLHELLQRKPKQLSGGQQQRVALGRCIVRNPQVFLFDEPLSNLDAKLRARMRIEIKRLHAQIPTTSVFVTHDQIEAMTLGDRVVIMRDGRVQQIGTPLAVYEKPANKFVAGFIGAPAMNFVDVTVRRQAGATTVETSGIELSVTPACARALEPHDGRQVVMGVRPEHLALGEAAPGSGFDARVEVVEQLGSEILLETRVGSDALTVARVPAETKVAPGDQVRLSAQLGRLHFFDPATELPIAG
ncbi:sn-glycerol-3-phosphate ABC transporter ATP-binding protein UgpC [Bradyrhizobium sp.]|uniref:ABC transporter ATP-binding protein n=1 Tax=Bradyrhizobium sp. TaxID=376 RepID=UPI001DC5F9B8|nr:sn-glycerol-3-phosphate ABC transporter ATP-binding protein UgpC [Bradyrhizobium sp.]MBI5318743.1 sn-glycerol-3-phosphate ABC transporter ATP-binding protein UgpC [Bradyrhizobium sp.]